MKDDKLNFISQTGEGSNKKRTSARSRRQKSFGYQILGFGGGSGVTPVTVSYLVVAGGGGGGDSGQGGGGGAGGYRNSFDGPTPLKSGTIDIGGDIPVTVGAGGAVDVNGSNSVLDVITATGGGNGDNQGPTGGAPGGSGGGVRNPGGTGGSGNAGGFSPPEGNNGGTNPGPQGSTGGGGAGAAGNGGNPGGPSSGGNGLASSITGSSVTRGGGGGGGSGHPSPAQGGSGGGGNGQTNPSSPAPATAATQSTGGGGGGSGDHGAPQAAGAGGSGIVIIRAPSAVSMAVSPGTNSVASCVGSCNERVATFTVSGTLTIS